MSTDDKADNDAQAAANRQKDADDRAKANEGMFDAEAETARVREQVAAAPAPGTDPEAKRRVAKTLAAQGIDPPEGYSTDPITEEDRAKFLEDNDKELERQRKENERAAQRGQQPEKVQGRSTTPRQKAAEEK